MSWLAVNEDGKGRIFDYKPHRDLVFHYWISDSKENWLSSFRNKLSKKEHFKLTGKILTWKDEPVEI